MPPKKAAEDKPPATSAGEPGAEEAQGASPSDILELVACRGKLKRMRQATRDMQVIVMALVPSLKLHISL
jgi:hypothetical protein